MKQSLTIISNNLKKLRIEKGLKQKEVAILLGMQCEDRLSHWENGTSIPSVINLFKLSGIYTVSPYEIYPDLVEKSKNSLICF